MCLLLYRASSESGFTAALRDILKWKRCTCDVPWVKPPLRHGRGRSGGMEWPPGDHDGCSWPDGWHWCRTPSPGGEGIIILVECSGELMGRPKMLLLLGLTRLTALRPMPLLFISASYLRLIVEFQWFLMALSVLQDSKTVIMSDTCI